MLGSLPHGKHSRLERHLRTALRWRLNGRDSVSNHQPHDCLLNRLFTRRSKKTSKLRVTGLCAGNSPVTGEFSAQMASITRKMFPFDDVIMGCSKVDPWFHPPKVLFHDYFSPSGEQLEQRILSYKQNNRLCSNISQILLLYKVWGYYNKFYSMKSLGIYHWYVRLPRLRIYYVLCSKTYRSFGGLFWAPAGSRRTSRDARICETRIIIYLNQVARCLQVVVTSTTQNRLVRNSYEPFTLSHRQGIVRILKYVLGRVSHYMFLFFAANIDVTNDITIACI